MAAGKLRIIDTCCSDQFYFAGVLVSICDSCGDFGRFMLSPDLHRLPCSLGRCLAVWALGDGLGWDFEVGAGRFGYYLGTEKLLKFDGQYQTVICSMYFSETMMGNKILN